MSITAGDHEIGVDHHLPPLRARRRKTDADECLPILLLLQEMWPDPEAETR
jgi:hypothetical protein